MPQVSFTIIIKTLLSYRRKAILTEIIFRNGFAKGETRTVEAVALRVSQHRDEEPRLLPLGGQDPAVGLAKQVQAMDKRDIRPVLFGEPLN